MTLSNKVSIFFFLGSLILFTVGLSNLELTQFETRFAYFAQEIGRQGFHFFPLLYGKPYPDYPASYPILIYFSSLIFGKVTLFSCVWPSAINAALTVSLTYRLGAFHKMSFGIAAVLFELATFYFVMTARSLSLDQFVLFATTLSFYFVYSDYLTGTHYRKWLPFVFLYGFLFRGPMGMIIPMAVIMTFDLLNRDFKNGLKCVLFGGCLFLVFTAVMLYCAYLEGGRDFVWRVIEMQGIGRINHLGHYPFYYYFKGAPLQYAISFPFAFIVILVLFPKIMKAENNEMKFMRYLLAWVAIILIGLSIPTEKKFRYLLPMTPAIALLSARILFDNSSWIVGQLRSLILKISFYFPIIVLFLVLFMEGVSFYKRIEWGAFYISAVLTVSLIFIVGTQALKMLPEKIARYQIQLAMGVGSFLMLIIFIVQPVHAYLNRTAPFAQAVNSTLLPENTLAFYKMGPDGEDIKLMVVLDTPMIPVFLSTESQLLNAKKTSVFVSRDTDFEKLSPSVKSQFLVLYRGKIGHQKSLIFRVSQ